MLTDVERLMMSVCPCVLAGVRWQICTEQIIIEPDLAPWLLGVKTLGPAGIRS